MSDDGVDLWAEPLQTHGHLYGLEESGLLPLRQDEWPSRMDSIDRSLTDHNLCGDILQDSNYRPTAFGEAPDPEIYHVC